MKEKMNKERLAELLQENFPRERSFLLPVLHFIHKEFGFLEESALEEAAKHLRVPSPEEPTVATGDASNIQGGQSRLPEEGTQKDFHAGGH